MTLEDRIKLYHIVYQKEGENLVEKALRICETGLHAPVYNSHIPDNPTLCESLEDLKKEFIYFINVPLKKSENPVIIVEAPKDNILVADSAAHILWQKNSSRWANSITPYKVWEKDKSKVYSPEFLISLEVPREDILGVLYKGKEYSRTDFIETFGQKITE